VVAHAEVGAEDLILRGEQAQLLERFLLGLGCGNPQRLTQPNVRRHHRVDEGVERVVAERGQHRGLVLGGWADVSFLKQIAFDIHLMRACRIPRAARL